MQDLLFSLKKDIGPTKLEKTHDAVILGGGLAGLTATSYTARAKLKTLVVEKKAIGGEAASTDVIENSQETSFGVQALAWIEHSPNMKV